MQGQVWDIIDGTILYRQILHELKSQPRVGMVELFVSDNCPLRCKHCFHADVRSMDFPLSFQEWSSLIDQFILMGVRHFHIAGREPFTEKITLDLLAYLSEKKKTINLRLGAISNGLNCRKHLRTIQDSALDYLEISIDGLADTHDFMRGKGTYRHVIGNLKEFLSALGNKRISTATALYKGNIDQIPEMLNSFSQLSLRRFFFQPVTPMGYALAMRDLLIDGEEYKHAIIQTKQKLADSKFQDMGVAVMFYIPPEMINSVCRGDEWLEGELLNFLLQGRSITKQGINYLQLDFDVAHIPFWRHLIVTEDGYLVSECSSRSVPNYIDHSAGSIRQMPLPELIYKTQAIAIGQIEKLLVNSHGGSG